MRRIRPAIREDPILRFVRPTARPRVFSLFAALPLAALAAAAAAFAQPPVLVDHGRVPRASGPIEVDGRLDEPAWRNALRIDVPFEVAPSENTPAPVETTCLLAFDETNLYVGCRAFDPEPKKIRAHVADRDQVFRNDYIGVLVDPFHDGRRGFEFMVNPMGVQMDASASEFGGGGGTTSVSAAPGEDFTWDAIWRAAGRITGEGYVVEMAIPFSSLRFPRGDGEQTWGVILYRAWPRDVMHKLRSVPKDRDRPCYFCQAGTISGFAAMKPGRNLEFDPTLTATRADANPDYPAGRMANGKAKGDLGLSARWSATPNLSLNLALNPDFSQIEADAAQLSINRQFALSYAEKRPFFLEGADFFATPFRVVYTRAVADPAWGVKVSGKDGANAFGAFVARDRATNLIFPGAQDSDSTSLDQENTTAVLRWRRDVGESSAVGALLTSREGDGYRNRVFGFDGSVRVSEKNSISFQTLASDTLYPAETAAAYGQPQAPFGGVVNNVEFDHTARDWNYWVGSTYRGARFRGDAGFMPQVGTRNVYAGGERVFWNGAGHWFNRIRIGTSNAAIQTDHGDYLGREGEVYVRYEGPLQSSLTLEQDYSATRYGGKDFDTGQSYLFFNFRPTGDLTASLGLQYGPGVDYDAVRAGRVLAVTPGATINVGRHFYLQLDHTFERLSRDGAWLYRANLSQARLIYQFTNRFFARAILQRTLIDRNIALYGPGYDARDDELFGQYLLSYKVNPQTMVFVGYSDTREGLDWQARDMRDRTFFVKLGYALVI